MLQKSGKWHPFQLRGIYILNEDIFSRIDEMLGSRRGELQTLTDSVTLMVHYKASLLVSIPIVSIFVTENFVTT